MHTTLANLTRTLSVLDANLKQKTQEDRDILGKLITLENLMKDPPRDPTNHPDPDPPTGDSGTLS